MHEFTKMQDNGKRQRLLILRNAAFSTVMVCMAALGAAHADTVAELDTSVSNGFWNCTGRVNPVVHTDVGTLALLDGITCDTKDTPSVAPFESRFLTEWVTDAIKLDTRRPFGLMLKFR